MDIADKASELTEKETKNLIKNRKKIERLNLNGRCYNCGAEQDKLFCDDDCRHDYEKVEKIKKSQFGVGQWR